MSTFDTPDSQAMPAGDDIEARARRRVARKMGFYMHALVFVCVNLGLYALHAIGGYPHFSRFPLYGWGLGLAIHGIVTFVGVYGDGMRQGMLEREIEQLRRQQQR